VVPGSHPSCKLQKNMKSFEIFSFRNLSLHLIMLLAVIGPITWPPPLAQTTTSSSSSSYIKTCYISSRQRHGLDCFFLLGSGRCVLRKMIKSRRQLGAGPSFF
jgi:hypothetical protein